MVLTDTQIKAIKDIINKHFNRFLISTIGPEAVSDEEIRKLAEQGELDNIIRKDDYFRLAYLLGKLRGTAGEDPSNISVNQFKQNLSTNPPGLTQSDLLSIDHAKKNAANFIDGLKDNTEKIMEGIIRDNNYEAQLEQLNETVRPALERLLREGTNVRELVNDLRNKTNDIQTDWKRILVTELNKIHNRASINEIAHRNKGKSNDDILVYCIGPLDAFTCSECIKFYHDGGSYKIYRLSELKANGTNYGKKRTAWSASVPPLHVSCRHRLVELPQGFSLDENGKVYFVGPEHHELNNDLTKSLDKKKK
jgi:hypothetical protein